MVAICARVLAGALFARMKSPSAGGDRGENYAAAVVLVAMVVISCLVTVLLVARSVAVVDQVCAKPDARC